jgi:hypothetical protein
MKGRSHRTHELDLKNVTDPALLKAYEFWKKVDQINHESVMHALILATVPFLIILIILLFVFKMLYHINKLINIYYKLPKLKNSYGYEIGFKKKQAENKISVHWHRNSKHSKNDSLQNSQTLDNSIVLFKSEK